MNDKFISFIFENFFFVFVLIFVFIFLFVSNQKKRQALKPLVKELAGKVLRFPLAGLKAKYNGVNFKILLIPASRHSPPYLYIYFYRRPSFVLTIRKESSLTRLGKRFGFVSNIKTRDAEFDKEFVLNSQNKGTILSLLNRPEVKQAIRDIFSKGFTVIKAKKHFFISKPRYKFKEEVTAENIRFLLERLYIISRGY